MPTLNEIVREVDRRSKGRPFGSLQPRRKRIFNLARIPSQVPFGSADDETWAMHVGGRKELQFNLGIERGLPSGDLRFGVAFSFEPSQTLPRIEILLPKVARFNDYFRENAETLSGFLMWHFDDGRNEATRHGPYPPRAIASDLFRRGRFVFLGGISSAEAPDFDEILRAFDSLMPIWEFVEAGDDPPPDSEAEPPLGRRRPPQRRSTVGTRAALTLDIDLRHNELQRRLLEALVEEHGQDRAEIEYHQFGGGRVDAIVKTDTERILFEIKTASTARGCIREALGQLFDYGCWPGRLPATRLVVVGSPPTDDEVMEFLARLSGLVPLAIDYRQVPLDE